MLLLKKLLKFKTYLLAYIVVVQTRLVCTHLCK